MTEAKSVTLTMTIGNVMGVMALEVPDPLLPESWGPYIGARAEDLLFSIRGYARGARGFDPRIRVAKINQETKMTSDNTCAGFGAEIEKAPQKALRERVEQAATPQGEMDRIAQDIARLRDKGLADSVTEGLNDAIEALAIARSAYLFGVR